MLAFSFHLNLGWVLRIPAYWSQLQSTSPRSSNRTTANTKLVLAAIFIAAPLVLQPTDVAGDDTGPTIADSEPNTPLVAADTSADRKRLPVPDAEAQQRAMQLVSTVFKAQFDEASEASDLNAKWQLARKLMVVAADTDEAAERYVLLRVARDVAAGAGDARGALAAIDTMTRLYEVEPGPMQTAA